MNDQHSAFVPDENPCFWNFTDRDEKFHSDSVILLVLTFLVEILMLARCGNQKVLQPAVPILLPVELVEW